MNRKNLDWFLATSRRILGAAATAYKLSWKVFTLMDQLENFNFDGEAVDHEWILNNRATLELYCMDEMRKQGILPVLDYEPKLEYQFNQERETFNFKLTFSGIQTETKPILDMGIMLDYGVVVGADAQTVSVLDAPQI